MKGSLASRWILSIAILLNFAILAPPSEGKTLEVYGEESLVHLSTDVIEAEIVEEAAGTSVVKVSTVHKKLSEKSTVAGF